MADQRSRRARKDRTGREQRRRSQTARARRPSLSTYYGRTLPAVTPGEFEFRLDLLRGRGIPSIALDTFAEAFEWNDEEAAMSGSVSLRRPDPSTWKSLPVGRGHRVRCRVRWAGRWYELWTMRCGAPEVTVETGQVQVPLEDDMALLKRSRRRWVFRTTKRRRRGYYPHEALLIAARREGIRLGAVAKAKHRVGKVDMRGSFLDLAVKLYTHEREKTGASFVLRMRNGRFEVVHYRRNRTLYVLADQLREAIVRQEPKVENPATVIAGRARIGSGHKATKIRHTEFRRDVVARYGYIRREKDFGRVESRAELRAKCRRELARQLRVDTSCTVQSQGIPFIRRGDGAQVVIPSDRFTGAESFVYATAVRHQVQGKSYTMQADFTRVDPFVKDRERREREARARARQRRKKGS